MVQAVLIPVGKRRRSDSTCSITAQYCSFTLCTAVLMASMSPVVVDFLFQVATGQPVNSQLRYELGYFLLSVVMALLVSPLP
jgi:hypothetical protein